MINYLRIPKVQLSICLFLIFASTLLVDHSLQKLLLLVVTFIGATISDLVFTYIRRRKFFVPSAAVTTSLIIVLLINPTLPLYVPVLAAALAMFSKNFIRVGRHIFNPASFGLIVTSLIFSSAIAWWGPGSVFSQSSKFLPLFIVLLLPFFVSGIRMKRYFTIFFFLVSYTLANLIFLLTTGNAINPNIITRLLLDPTIIFFSLVMAPEPMTTPYSRNSQILFGLFLGTSAVIISRFIFQIPFLQTLDPLVIALLLGNLLFFKKR